LLRISMNKAGLFSGYRTVKALKLSHTLKS